MALKLLSIGNSFSQDAHRYILEIAKANEIEIEINNLYIGGCSLERHYNNMISGEEAYSLEEGKHHGIRQISLKEAVSMKKWDVVTLQQASGLSFKYEAYEPYLIPLANFVREHLPEAKLAIHKTWMYEPGCEKLANIGLTVDEMYEGLDSAYARASKDANAEIFIPAGAVMYKLLKLGYKVHRDGYHASLGLGRYAIALTWLRVLFGRGVKALAVELDEVIGERALADIDAVVNEALSDIGL